MALTPDQVKDVCMAGNTPGHASCRYLDYDAGDGVFLCAKKHPLLKKIKDEAVRYHEAEARRISLPVIDYFDQYQIGHANNCPGYLYLKNTPQGFDVP